MCNLSSKKMVYHIEEEEAVEAVAADEGGEAEVGEAEGRGEKELDHHIIGMMGGGVGENEVGGEGDENAQEEEGPGDHDVPSIGLVYTHPPEAGPKALELVASVGEVACV
ncbi:hypothetical protein B296_00000634 [Ensete ventricosum]|uniref:Uncharacterized protein n=1 Tax=Ensete ventricosum TaxID=4639 RepID=A0A427B4J2_ENSVE|nr:hypothetical protein B296_00000634 [Ensete ventricosum]